MGCRIDIGGVKQDTLWIGTSIQQEGPTFSKLKYKVHGSWRNVGPSCYILVPIHNVFCFIAFYTTNVSPTSHSVSQREIFKSTWFPCFFFYHAEGLVRQHLCKLTRAFAKCVVLKKDLISRPNYVI